MREWTVEELNVAEAQVRGKLPPDQALLAAQGDAEFITLMSKANVARRVVTLTQVMNLMGGNSSESALVALMIGIRVGARLERNRAECDSLERMFAPQVPAAGESPSHGEMGEGR